MTAASERATGPAVWMPRHVAWGRGDGLAVAAWTAAVLALFWRAALLQEALFYFDITELNYPYRDFLTREFQAGRFSRWMPGLFCGLPLYSESQAGYFHPLKWLYLFLPAWQAFNLDTVLSVWLTGLIGYGWLRRHVGSVGAFTGAAILGLGGFTWAHWFHTSMINALASVPLILWGLEWAWSGAGRRGVAVAALGLAAQVFAGHLQDALLSVLLIGLYGLYRAATAPDRSRRWRSLRAPGGVVLLGVAISAVQWIPSKELIDRSPRTGGLTYEEVVYGSWHPQLLPMSLMREAFGTRARDTDWMDGFYPYHEMNVFLGILGLGLAVVGGAAYRDRWVGFWVLLAGLSLLLMLGKHTVLFDLLYRVPVLGTGRIPVRYHLWLTIAVAALAAIGADRLARADLGPVRLRGAVGLIAALVLLSVPILVWTYVPVWTESGRWTLRYHLDRYGWLGWELSIVGLRATVVALGGWAAAGAAIRETARPGRREALAATVAGIVALELVAAHWWDVPTIDASYWTKPPATVPHLEADPQLQRIFGFGVYAAGEPGYASTDVDFFRARDTLAWSLPPVWGLKAGWGHTPIYPRRLGRYAEAANAAGVRFELESVSHVLTGPGTTLGQASFEAPYPVATAWVHASRRTLPRARFVGRPVYARDEDDAVRQLLATGASCRDRVVVEDPDRPIDPVAEARGNVRILEEEPERVLIEVAAEQPGYLVLADTYDPGWSATVDGSPAPIRPAYIAFRAVALEAGRHRVEFRYEPAGWRLGAWISSVGLALALLGCWRPGASVEGPGSDHGTTRWSDRWPMWMAVGVAVVILISIGQVDRQGRLSFQPRWGQSFHRFTWGAGIEGMKPR